MTAGNSTSIDEAEYKTTTNLPGAESYKTARINFDYSTYF